MPYKRREPVPEREMLKTRWKGHQTLRNIYAMVDDEEVKKECRLAMAMAKSMHERLKYYKEKENAD